MTRDTLGDEEWERVQDILRQNLSHYDVYREESNDNFVVDDRPEHLILADQSGLELNELAENADVNRSALSARMHDEAESRTDHDWGYSDPVVIIKSREQREAEKNVLHEIARYARDSDGLAAAVDRYVVEGRGQSQTFWAKRTRRTQGTVSTNIRGSRDSE